MDEIALGHSFKSGLYRRGFVSIREPLHTNLQKMKAVLLTMPFLKTSCRNNQVLITSDNTSLMVYINKQGGKDPQNSVLWCEELLLVALTNQDNLHPSALCTNIHSKRITTKPGIPEPPCMHGIWSSALQEHRFTAEVAERTAVPQITQFLTCKFLPELGKRRSQIHGIMMDYCAWATCMD